MFTKPAKICTVCGGARGFIEDYYEYPAHKNCYRRVPVDFVLWWQAEKRRLKGAI